MKLPKFSREKFWDRAFDLFISSIAFVPALIWFLGSEVAAFFRPARSSGSTRASGPIPVADVAGEYRHLLRNPCACGGMWAVDRQEAAFEGDSTIDTLAVACGECGKTAEFRFILPSCE